MSVCLCRVSGGWRCLVCLYVACLVSRKPSCVFESCLVSCRIYISRVNYSSVSGLVADSCLRVSPACVVSCLADHNRLEDVVSLAVIRVAQVQFF